MLSAQAPRQSVASKRKQAVIPAAALRPSLPSLVPLAGDRHCLAPVFLCQQPQPVRKLLVTVVDDAGVEQHSSREVNGCDLEQGKGQVAKNPCQEPNQPPPGDRVCPALAHLHTGLQGVEAHDALAALGQEKAIWGDRGAQMRGGRGQRWQPCPISALLATCPPAGGLHSFGPGLRWA